VAQLTFIGINSLYKVNLKSNDSVAFAKKRKSGLSVGEKGYNPSIEVQLVTLDKFVNDNLIENYLLPVGFKLFSILDISGNLMNGRVDWVQALYKRIA